MTGINGFAGSHLADYLLSRGEEVIGMVRSLEHSNNLRHIRDRLSLFPCDIRDAIELRRIFEAVRPNRVYHLASMTFVPQGEKESREVFETNFFGTLNLMEAVKECGGFARVLSVGSSEEYGEVPKNEGPISEKFPLEPVSHYGVSKASADLLANSFFKRNGIDVIRARPFNHTGPRQDPRFVCSSFARQIAAIELGAEPVLTTGNLDSRRDFHDVRDTVRAYHDLMERGNSGEVYNICSGKGERIRDILQTLLKHANREIRVETDPEKFRPSNFYPAPGDFSRIRNLTGWVPRIPLDQTLRDLLEYWRGVLEKRKGV